MKSPRLVRSSRRCSRWIGGLLKTKQLLKKSRAKHCENLSPFGMNVIILLLFFKKPKLLIKEIQPIETTKLWLNGPKLFLPLGHFFSSWLVVSILMVWAGHKWWCGNEYCLHKAVFNNSFSKRHPDSEAERPEARSDRITCYFSCLSRFQSRPREPRPGALDGVQCSRPSW